MTERTDPGRPGPKTADLENHPAAAGFAEARHDHGHCMALETAERLCARRGARLTKLRRRVLELVWSSLEHGLIHRIESRNAFVGCPAPSRSHAGQFLICRDCGAAAELADPGIDQALARGAAALGFTVERKTVELGGLCPACREAEEGERDAG
jgi:Fur family zinc uptake transcriptional regulator